MRQNPWRYNAPPGWNNIQDAPRDGTVIEIQNNYGIAPTWNICRWERNGWQNANDPNSGVGDGPWLSWKPYAGEVSDYRDPTNGQQETNDYWLLAAGLPPSFATNARRLPSVTKESAPARFRAAKEPKRKAGWLARLFGHD